MHLLDTQHQDSDVEHIKKVITALCEKLDYLEEDVSKLFYMEIVLANVWFIEDGMKINEAWMQIAEAIVPVEE